MCPRYGGKPNYRQAAPGRERHTQYSDKVVGLVSVRVDQADAVPADHALQTGEGPDVRYTKTGLTQAV